MAWSSPPNYSPRPDLEAFLVTSSPRPGTGEFYMVIYWQWRYRTFKKKTIEKAWDDLDLPPILAREAIDKKAVPTEIYSKVLERARMPGDWEF